MEVAPEPLRGAVKPFAAEPGLGPALPYLLARDLEGTDVAAVALRALHTTLILVHVARGDRDRILLRGSRVAGESSRSGPVLASVPSF
jgi:hypothetical protein